VDTAELRKRNHLSFNVLLGPRAFPLKFSTILCPWIVAENLGADRGGEPKPTASWRSSQIIGKSRWEYTLTGLRLTQRTRTNQGYVLWCSRQASEMTTVCALNLRSRQ
jgi:hypothetical protein